MRFLLITGMFLMSLSSYGQDKYDYNWMFGWPNVESDNNDYGIQLSFTGDTLAVFDRPNNIPISFANTTMSDSLGNLLFYTNGCSISNYLGETIENGDSLNPGQVHDIQCELGYTVTEGTLNIPIKNENNAYYLFHQGLIYYENLGFTVHGFPFYATKIDMAGNIGEGKVLFKNQAIWRIR